MAICPKCGMPATPRTIGKGKKKSTVYDCMVCEDQISSSAIIIP